MALVIAESNGNELLQSRSSLFLPHQQKKSSDCKIVGERKKWNLQGEERGSQNERKSTNKRVKNECGCFFSDALISTLSALYGKLIVVLGVALPVTQAITPGAKTTANDGFYLYLFSGSMMFLTYMYMSAAKEDAVNRCRPNSASDSDINIDGSDLESRFRDPICRSRPQVRYGSFYLCMGVAGFGIGSMIYSILEAGQYLELRSEAECADPLILVTPLLRVAFVLLQMIFIFSNNHKLMAMYRYKTLAKFGLMHMIGTNLCQWLYVLVEETKSGILRFINQEAIGYNHGVPKSLLVMQHSDQEILTKNITNCWNTHIMPSLLENASPFLFPCTVEYSLLCAVILGVIWKNGCDKPYKPQGNRNKHRRMSSKDIRQSGVNVIYARSISRFSVDCDSAHKGLFAGLLILVLSIISLIMFFELVRHSKYVPAAVLQVNIWETFVFLTSAVAAVACSVIIKNVGLRARRRRLELEHILLFVTQSGVFLYFLFQIIGGYFSLEGSIDAYMRIIAPVAALFQSICQTVLILDAWKRRCNSNDEMTRKPGRQLVTFLLIANLAMWVVNRLKNNRAEFHPMQISFYGVWAWTIITHVSMPLVVCYRFQSTVCLYEIWKHVYKMRPSEIGI